MLASSFAFNIRGVEVRHITPLYSKVEKQRKHCPRCLLLNTLEESQSSLTITSDPKAQSCPYIPLYLSRATPIQNIQFFRSSSMDRFPLDDVTQVTGLKALIICKHPPPIARNAINPHSPARKHLRCQYHWIPTIRRPLPTQRAQHSSRPRHRLLDYIQ